MKIPHLLRQVTLYELILISFPSLFKFKTQQLLFLLLFKFKTQQLSLSKISRALINDNILSSLFPNFRPSQPIPPSSSSSDSL
ncbi:hypothetical protein LguiB_033322 [Lonicera macranthoides]